MQIFRYLIGLKKLPFVRDVLTIQAGALVFMGVSLVSSAVFARVLGADRYGLYAVIIAFVSSITTLLNIGQGSSLLVFYAEQYGKKDMHGMSVVLRNFIHSILLNTTVLLVLFIVAPRLSEALYGRTDIGQLARIFIAFQIVDIWNSMTIILLQAVRRVKLKVTFEQTENIGFLLLAMLAVIAGFGIKGILVAQLIVSITCMLWAAHLLASMQREGQLPSIREVLGVRFTETEPYFMQGLFIALDKNVGNFFPQGLLFFLSLGGNPAIVGIARISIQLSALPRMFILPQAGELSATVFANLASHGTDMVRKSAIRLIKHAVALQVIASMGAMLLIPIVIPLVYSDKYNAAIPLTLWLIVCSLPAGACIANAPLLRLKRRIPFSTLQALASWALMAIVITQGMKYVGPEAAFVIAYCIGLSMPLVITAYIFTTLLRVRPSPLASTTA